MAVSCANFSGKQLRDTSFPSLNHSIPVPFAGALTRSLLTGLLSPGFLVGKVTQTLGRFETLGTLWKWLLIPWGALRGTRLGEGVNERVWPGQGWVDTGLLPPGLERVVASSRKMCPHR